MTNEEFDNLIVDYLNKLQLPNVLSVLSHMLKRMSDSEANHASQVSMAAATAAQSDTARLATLLRGASDYFSQIENNVDDSIKLGLTTGFTLTGTTPEFDTQTVTGYSWVTANTVVLGFSPAARTSAEEVYNVAVNNYVAGVGFDMTLYASIGSVAASDYEVYWIGFPNGVNA